jgi:hypothetical protein
MATCAECRAEISWYKTETGKMMPVDPARVMGGNLDIGDDGIARVVKGQAHVARRISHYVTCSVLQERRRRHKKAAAADAEHIAKKQLGLFGGK